MAAVGTTVVALPVYCVATLAPELENSLGFGARGVGALVSAFYLGAGVGGMPSGRLAEWLGGTKAAMAAGVLCGGCLEAMGLFAHSLWALAPWLSVAGFGSSLMAAGVNMELVATTRRDRLGAVLGIGQAAPPIALLLEGFSLPALSGDVGWRVSAMVARASVVVPVTRALASVERGTAGSRVKRERGAVRVPRALWWLSAWFGLGVCGATGVTAYLVEAAIRNGMSLRAGGMLAAVAGGVAAAMRIVMVVVADRSVNGALPLVSGMLLIGGCGCGLMLLGSEGMIPLLFALGAIVGLGAGWGWNGVLMDEVLRGNVNAAGRATGVMQVGGRSGNVLAPVGFVLVIRHAFFGYAWLMAGATMWIASVVVWRLRVAGEERGSVGAGRAGVGSI